MQIEAKNISFRYRENTPWILKDVSLKIEEGERVRWLQQWMEKVRW